MRGLLLEGINGAGKTSVYKRAINKIASDTPDALVAVSQQYTQRLVDAQQRPPAASDVLSMYDPLLSYLAAQQKQFIESPFLRHPRASQIQPRFIMESTHLNCIVEFGLQMGMELLQITNKMRALGARLVLLSVPDKQIRERCVESTRKWRSPGWMEYQKRIAQSDDELEVVFRDRQRLLSAAARKAGLPMVEICTSAQNWDEIADECHHFAFKKAS